MNIAFPQRYGMLAGGVSLAALSVFVLNSGVLQDTMMPSPIVRQDQASSDGPAPKHRRVTSRVGPDGTIDDQLSVAPAEANLSRSDTVQEGTTATGGPVPKQRRVTSPVGSDGKFHDQLSVAPAEADLSRSDTVQEDGTSKGGVTPHKRVTRRVGADGTIYDQPSVDPEASVNRSESVQETTGARDPVTAHRRAMRRVGPDGTIYDQPASDRLRSASAEVTDGAKPMAAAEAEADLSRSVAAQPMALKSEAVAESRERRQISPKVVADLHFKPDYQDQGRDKFTDIETNPLKLTSEDPVSTFSVDVDTASYAFVRSMLNAGTLPQMDAVRVEEMINYFDYSYPVPGDRAVPFNADVSIMPTPWNAESRLLRIGIKGYELQRTEAPKANLVFLIDTSGSMNAPDKLPLLRNAFKLLVSSLQPDDTVSIVTYAGSAGTVLEPTPIAEKAKILSALDRLGAGGSTAGAEGIRQAYQLAEANMDQDGVNRVILATDGDFNVGITDTEELKSFVERKRETDISLSVLGFGRGNYNDELMQTLAQNGNGNAAYIDTLNEARKTLVAEAGSTLFTIAKDVKLQLEFNPDTVKEYRLIGYETRQLKREDFNNDKVDAGDIGAGHMVTALYEFTPVGAEGLVDNLRYQQTDRPATTGTDGEYGFLKIRYKQPDSDTSELIEVPVTRNLEVASISQASRDSRFAASVAAFGQILRGGQYTGSFTLDDVIELARASKGDDPYGYRSEFVTLVELAKSGQALEPLKQ